MMRGEHLVLPAAFPADASERLWRAVGWLVGSMLVLAGAAATAVAVERLPVVAVGGAAAFMLLALAIYLSARLDRRFLVLSGAWLVGYAFLGKGFAYLGAAPVFVGEVLLFFGLTVVLLHGIPSALLRQPTTWLLGVFVIWAAACTIPQVPTYGVNALRDGATWGYALFAIVVASSLLRTGWVERVPEWYERWIHWFLPWAPLALLVYRFAEPVIPTVPGSEVAILTPKGGDIAVHLAGAMAFMLLEPRRRTSAKRWIGWVLWVIAIGLAIPSGRATILTMICAASVLVLLRPTMAWFRPMLLTSVLVAIAATFQLRIELTEGREVSVAQVLRNVTSVTGTSSERGLQGTKEWRLNWWRDIVDYTVYGEHFWMGKGYGVNLAADDGYGGTGPNPLRSPHSIHMTVLARSGVPGLATWMLLQATFALQLLRAFFLTRHTNVRLGRIYLWVLVYWVAFMVNASFDVFLEGPQGGIWFWCLTGFGLAALQLRREPT